MPRRDGSGPQGLGPFTGRGAGNCAIAQPQGGEPYGYVGQQGLPVRGWELLRWMNPLRWLGRGRGSGGGRGRRAQR